MHDAIIVGGGISGLSCAWLLQQRGLDVLVLESATEAGGNIRTLEHEGFQLETGPYSFMGSSEYMWQLVEELGIEDLAEPSAAAADNRFIYRDGRLLALPLGLGSFLFSPLLSCKAKLRLMLEPCMPNGAKPDDTAWQFFVRRFGSEAAQYIMGPFISGIYAGDPKLLGARASFPKFYNFERDSGSMIIGAFKYMRAKRKRLAREQKQSRKGLWSFKGGLGAITRVLSERLGSRLLTGAAVEQVSRDGDVYTVHSTQGTFKARTVISAVPPPATAQMLGQLVPGVVGPLNAIPMSPVTLIHWSQPAQGNTFPAGFGFLMPRHYGLRVLGTVFASQLFNGRAPEGQVLISSFYGGMLDRPAMELSDQELTAVLLKEHNEIFKTQLTPPEMLCMLRYPGAIPQLLPDHPERIATVKQELTKLPGVFLAGNYLTGVGVEHAVTSGYHAAQAAGTFLIGTPAKQEVTS